MPVLLRDLIELPEHVRQGDFVLRLSEGITKPDETLRNYVVTPQLAKCFDQALDLIKGAVQAKSSKGAYLHGSFGSGKSHFMAVLLLLIEGNPRARGLPELAATVAGLDTWAVGKRFLLVPYHMIGARDLTSAVLGGYVDHVLRIHPDAPVPGVYLAERLFGNARDFRKTMGDAVFFSKLNGEGRDRETTATTVADDGWGNLADAWDATSFDAAMKAGPKDERRARLVGDLVAYVFPAMKGTAEFVDIDSGLAIISQHAKQLGYTGLILFLDELVLWLASHAADSNFIAQEGQKLAKLVESQNADRPTPIVSFIARQRDLRELVGENMLGVQQVAFADSLKHWDQRFDVVRLDDRNLTTIAQKRVLRPKSEAAKQQVDQAFRETEKIRQEVMSVLLTNNRTPGDFRAVYPFSPALIETLVALSALLQRERTALKIMFQILVEQRDTLQLGSVVPVGDLFDIIMRGDEPFSEVMKAHAENAKKMYREKLLPIIEQDIGVSLEEALKLPDADARRNQLLRDTRLAKTLLLAALAPEVESFKGMTVNRLAALNHGSIRTPIPGREGQLVYERVRKWAAEIGQIRLGDEPVNQTVTVQLTGVDTEGILGQAANEDNEGNRVRMIKRLLFEKLGIQAEDSLIIEHGFTWRATMRTCEVLFSNVRELNDESLRNDGCNWKLIIDYPFDPSPAHSPRDDFARIEKFRTSNAKGARTLVWLPSFFSQPAKKDLGRLVVLEHILTGPRFDGYAARLTAIDRAQARTILENQRSSLRVRVLEYLERAYGVGSDTAGILDTTHQLEREEQAISLHPDVSVRPPAAANLTQALAGLLDQALAGQFPGHPVFDADAKLGRAAVQRVWGELQKALTNPEGRTMIEQAQRREVRSIVTALKLAQMSEAHLALDTHWRTHFERKLAQHGTSAVTVIFLRNWINEPKAMGLPVELENLIMLTFATQTNRAWFRFGSNPHQASIEDLPDNAELREQTLPDEQTWSRAVERAAAVFGLAPSPLRSATNAVKLTQDLGQQVGNLLESARELVREVQARLTNLNVPPETSARLKSAQAGLAILEALRSATEHERISVLANAKLEEQGVGVGTSLKQASAVVRALREAHWFVVDSAGKLQDQRRVAGEALTKRARELLQHDELAQPLSTTLRRIIEDAAKLLADTPPPVSTGSPVAPAPSPLAVPVVTGITSGSSPLGTSTPVAVTSNIGGSSPYRSSELARWAGSDDAEVHAFYGGQTEKIERNRQLVRALKRLYRQSQVESDATPKGVPADQLTEVLEVHHIVPLFMGGADERHNMMVVTPTLHALIHADQSCVIDLKSGKAWLFGRELRLSVHAVHNG
jgi:hypothetical protein